MKDLTDAELIDLIIDALTSAAYVAVQMVATDIMLFAGTGPDEDP
ncbi:hypothetical protein [Thermomonospora umbrina]|uniref:Uncharacterized protein n=1 Tax=Thermomonospora umbrina TaxID=111806 RepID=A0A3D9T762_9ACTN|nr:hypothetical protein [Thermomonospora umbrina]REF00515.1 hypothetical protein DFJ69_6059 [Thermomonospora umbrina]